MASDLGRFDLTAMLRCGSGLRAAAHGAMTTRAAAEAMVRFLYEDFGGATGQLALVRFYRTQGWSTLDTRQRVFAERLLGDVTPTPDLRCLCLVATAGLEPAWNDRRQSRGHQAIPLPDPEIIERAPMIAQLLRGFGLDLASVVRPDATLRAEMHGRTYGVFHVERAVGSRYIPAQEDFVRRYGITSVVGFGGGLRGGDIFAVILFSRVHVGPDAADRFRSLALDVKSAVFNLSDAPPDA
jgi:hypothetical protein